MPSGLFRTTDQSVQVEYDKVSIPIPQSTYEKNGATSPISTNCPPKTNIGPHRRSCARPGPDSRETRPASAAGCRHSGSSPERAR